MAHPNKNMVVSSKAHKVFKETATELSNGKVVRIKDVLEALAYQKEELIKLVKKVLGK